MRNRNRFIQLAVYLISLLVCKGAVALCPETFGIVGGTDLTGAPFAYLVQSGGSFSAQLLPSEGLGAVGGVAMNGSGTGLIGGSGFAYYTYPNGTLSPRLFSVPGIMVNSVALNNSGIGLMGGTSGGKANAVFVYPNYSFSPLLLSVPGGAITSVAINDNGVGLVGGDNSTDAIAYLVFPNATLSSQLLSGHVTGGQVNSVAINPSGTGILGGTDGVTNAFAYFVSASGSLSSQLLTPPINGAVNSVAINASSLGLVGGEFVGTGPFAYLVYPNGTLSPQLLPLLGVGTIQSVAINDAQTGLIGGDDGFNPILYIVHPDGSLSPQLLPAQSGGTVRSVAINMFGAGLAAGGDGLNTFTYLVAPSGGITAIYPSVSGQINGVAMIQALSQIQTECLGGNNLTVAKYINKYAPEKAFYFLPALMDGTLPHALESVAPMRNAASLFTADNNLFLLNQGLSRHLRDLRHVRLYDWSLSQKNTAANEWSEEDGLEASLDWSAHVAMDDQNESPSSFDLSRPYTLWTEVIGAFSYQKEEHQTPGFDPITGGMIAAFDAQLNRHTQVGGGVLYTYTHIHQHRGSGDGHINQEYLFAYGLWGNRHFYVDGALWGGFFEIHQVRKIHMTGFDFRSVSDPWGGQLSPHLEVGGDFYPWACWLTMEPFAMFDWANAWQRSYKEKGSGPFNMGQKSHYSCFLRSEIGIRFYEEILFGSWRLTFQEKAAYANKKPFGVGTVNAFLVGSPGAFTVETLSTTQNLGIAEFAMIFEPEDLTYPFGTIAYQGEFSVPYQSHQILLELSWSF